MISRLTSSILLALTVLLSVTDLIAQPAVSLESGWPSHLLMRVSAPTGGG